MRTQEFYPSIENGAFASPFAIGNANFSTESGFDMGPDGDEDNTDYEDEDAVDGLTECSAPKYRTLVKQKKSEFKDQYGKGHFLVKDCGLKPARNNPFKYSPVIRITWPKKLDNTDAYDAADRRFADDMAKWHACADGANGPWVPGWRAKWRQYKRDGNLDVLKAASNCQTTGGSPLDSSGNPIQTTPTPPATNIAEQTIKAMSCQDMKDRFGIIPGSSWGSAANDKDLLKLVSTEWTQRGCFMPAASTAPASTGNESTPGTTPDVAQTGGLVNKIINNKGIAIIVGAIIVIVLITAVILIPTKKPA